MWSADGRGASGSARCLAPAASLAACQRDAPTELGPETARPGSAAGGAGAAGRTFAHHAGGRRGGASDHGRRYPGRHSGDLRTIVTAAACREPPATRMTRAYLARELEALGFEPGAPTALGAAVELGRRHVQRAGEVAVRARRRERRCSLATTEFVAASGVQAARAGLANAEVVFVGYGIQAPEYGWDDFKGADLSGKVLLMLNNDPDWDPRCSRAHAPLLRPLDVQVRERRAPRRGRRDHHPHDAVGRLPVAGGADSWSGEQFELPARRRAAHAGQGLGDRGRGAQALRLGGQDLDGLVEAAKRRDFQPGAARRDHVARRCSNTITRTQTANVSACCAAAIPRSRTRS